MNKPGKKFWVALVLFSLIGQVAWVVENMYLNVFIYKMFSASPADISLMVSASAVSATLTTILMGALSDRVGKRKIFICGGYLIWGVTILGFGLVRMDILTPLCQGVAEAAALGVSLVIILDCAMTFFGSTANDAAFNAWMTEKGDASNRGKIEGINSMMPLLAILVVFGGFMGFDLDKADSWTTIYIIIGGIVLLIGVLGIFLIDEVKAKEACGEAGAVENAGAGESEKISAARGSQTSYWYNLVYSFRPQTITNNKLLYAVIVAFAIFGISIQTYMPYLIIYYEQTLQMSNYVIVFAPAIILAAIFTAIYGGLYDQLGFQKSIVPSIGILVAGYVILYFSVSTLPVFIGTLLMMCGYLSGMAVFGAIIRERIPENMAGRFQGIRIIGQVLIPGVIGPIIGAWVLRDAAQIENQDGTYSFLPDRGIWSAAIVVALVLAVTLYAIFLMIRRGHYELWTEAAERERGARADATDVAGGVRGDRWQGYPRPQMKRGGYLILNNDWKLNGHTIRMPFPPESMLAEYKYSVGSRLTYETTFRIPENFTKERILLHFGAVDQIAEVWVNGQCVGHHEGGYLAFSFDITEYVQRDAENILIVKATDTLNRDYPYGKQCKKRGGMWYTPVSGIWQSVWLENVPEKYIKNIVLKPDLEGVDIEVEIQEQAAVQNSIRAIVTLHNGEVYEKSFGSSGSITDGNVTGRIQLTDHICADGQPYEPRLWSCEEPYLYSMRIVTDTDEVETYFALRTIGIREVDGVKRVCLNNKPIFMHGVLDQGYFCDGIYLPYEPEEYERDILRMKELGFNMLRKHIKVEPEAFYYYCDKHGMLVMQDMVNNGGYSFMGDTALPTIGMKQRKDTTGMKGKRKEFFIEHTRQTIRQLYNHPCIVAYTIFNEGWGQFESDWMYDYVKELDNSRLIDSTSGWFAQEKNDFDSEHIYFKVIDLEIKDRPLFVSECGGYTRVIDGHYYSKYNTYGYGGAKDAKGLTDMIDYMYRNMILSGIPKGVCGCVYTQLSDVEDEVNGLYTYDRKVCKVDKSEMQRLAKELTAPFLQ